jgi:hypothetical protein
MRSESRTFHGRIHPKSGQVLVRSRRLPGCQVLTVLGGMSGVLNLVLVACYFYRPASCHRKPA